MKGVCPPSVKLGNLVPPWCTKNPDPSPHMLVVINCPPPLCTSRPLGLCKAGSSLSVEGLRWSEMIPTGKHWEGSWEVTRLGYPHPSKVPLVAKRVS